jgi:hypothetical protein
MNFENKKQRSRTWSVVDLSHGASEILQAAADQGPQRLIDGERLYEITLVGLAREKRRASTILAKGGPLEDEDFLD